MFAAEDSTEPWEKLDCEERADRVELVLLDRVDVVPVVEFKLTPGAWS